MSKCVAGMNGGTFGSWTSTGLGQVAPAVPLTTVPVVNPSTMPMQVVIAGGTMTAVIVNGTTAGAGAGTYAVPGQGSISMTYSAAPTWAWSVVPVFAAALNANGSAVSRTGAN